MVRLLPILLALLLARPSRAFSPVRSAVRVRAGAATELAASSDAPAPVERVAIVGAGIAGLSLAHALRSARLREGSGAAPIQIDMFDARPDLDEKAGSGIQLTGGMAALRQISSELQEKVARASLPLDRVVTRCRPWFGSEPWKIFELEIAKELRDAAMDTESGLGSLVTEGGDVLAYTILRGTLQRIMHDELMSEQGIEVQFDKKLSGISYSDSEAEGIVCKFADGSTSGPYDLVVGSDGIQSAVKQYVNTGTISGDSKPSSIYSGLRITFAIQEGSEADKEDIKSCQFNQWFGTGAYSLTSQYGAGVGVPRAKGAFLVYPDANYIGPFPRKKSDEEECVVEPTTPTEVECTTEPVPLAENADWTQDKRVTLDHVTECLEILQYASIPGNEAARIIEKSDRFFDLGVYLHNPFSWNGWSREVKKCGSGEKTGKYVVTTGDASHAMPPFLGQGANQAVQDACALASRVLEYNAQVRQPLNVDDPSATDLRRYLKEYENKRWLPTTSITAKAAFLGYLEVGPTLFSNFRDAFFFTMGKIGVARKVFLDAATPKM
ncbi:hypothetical protein ACHAXT_002955 [Thalassiosira profunda]